MMSERAVKTEINARLLPDWLWALLAALIFVAGLVVRLYDLYDPPLDFHPTRQMHSALIARGMYYENLPEAPLWQRELAVQQWRMEGLIEPQVFERLTAWTYSLMGEAALWVPRLYSILFWMVGAVFLFLIAAEMIGREGALVSALFFLIWPYVVSASRAFQPDPLMVSLIIAAIWALRRWLQRTGWAWAVAAGLLGGLAIYIKPVALFFVAPVFAAALLASFGLWKAARTPQVWVMAALALLPYLIYMIEGVYLSKHLIGQFSLRFFPEMWLDPAFYLRWISNLGRAISFGLVLVAVLGIFTVRGAADRAILVAYLAGYLICGMALPHHISTHDYYHLPLFPLAALGVGAVAERTLRALQGPTWLARAAVAGVITAALLVTGYEARTLLKRSDFRPQAQMWQEIGEQVGPGAAAVVLTPDYGTGLAYWGWTTPTNWPTADEIRWREGLGQAMGFEDRFAELAEGRGYFVISPPAELNAQPDLMAYLETNYFPLHQGEDYLLYDLMNTPPGP